MSSERELADKINLHLQLGKAGPGFHLGEDDLCMIVKALLRDAAATTTTPIAWRHKHWPNEPWQYRDVETFGTPYPYYEPLYATPQPVDAAQQAPRPDGLTADELRAAASSGTTVEYLKGYQDAMKWAGEQIAVTTTALPSTDHCAKCGCETKGEVALVDGEIWCHPCADAAQCACMRGGYPLGNCVECDNPSARDAADELSLPFTERQCSYCGSAHSRCTSLEQANYCTRVSISSTQSEASK